MCACCEADKSCSDRGVCEAPAPGADTDELSGIQQCGNWRRTNDSHMKSHFSVCAISARFSCSLDTHKVNKLRANSIIRKQMVSSPLSFATITVIVLVASWMCTYSEACWIQSCFNQNSLTVFTESKLCCCARLRHIFIFLSSNPQVKQQPRMVEQARYLPFFFLHLGTHLLYVSHEKVNHSVKGHFFSLAHVWPGATKYCRLNRSRHITTNQF